MNLFCLLSAGALIIISIGCHPLVKKPTHSEPKLELIKRDSNYIGLTVNAAKELALKEKRRFRISNLDGQPMILTKDFRPRRVNATVVNNHVIAITLG